MKCKMKKVLKEWQWVLLALFTICICSCKDDDDNTNAVAFDPSKPVLISDFTPKKGGTGQRLVIYGENFGLDKSLVNVMIGGKKATIINVNNNSIYCLVPSQAYDGDIKVIVGGEENQVTGISESTFEYDKILGIFRKYDIGYFVYIGGNDSMDTVHKLAGFCERMRIDDVKIIGAPKTIDNDLMETDHCPGFGSAAKYVAATMSEIACDCNVYAQPSITIVEIMGRDAGWLTASSALGRLNGDSAPDLIYLCERPFLVDRFLEDVREKMAEKHSIVIAVSEGLRNEEGDYVTDSLQNRAADAFGHKILAGAARYLEEILRFEIGCKVRSIELNVMQRCASHVASASDIYESRLIGAAAADYAISGGTGKMACIRRTSVQPYRFGIDFVDIGQIANHVKTVPDEWINEAGNDVTEEMLTYLLPLIQGELPCTYKNGVPVHLHLY